MSVAERLMEVDTKISRIVQRSNRRRYTFGRGSPHEWRRDYGEAEKVFQARKKARAAEGFRPRYQRSPANIDGTVLDNSTNPDDAGTNAILQEFGLTLKQRDEAFIVYGKDVVKTASRMAVQYARMHGVNSIKRELHHLFEALHWLGQDYTRELVVRRGMKLSDVMDGNAVEQLIQYTTPQNVYVRKPLEVIAANTQIETGPRLVIGVPYQPAHYLGTRQRR